MALLRGFSKGRGACIGCCGGARWRRAPFALSLPLLLHPLQIASQDQEEQARLCVHVHVHVHPLTTVHQANRLALSTLCRAACVMAKHALYARGSSG